MLGFSVSVKHTVQALWWLLAVALEVAAFWCLGSV